MNEPIFDYGGEVSEKEVNVKVWPKEGNMTALIDGDLLPYMTAFATEDIIGIQAQALVDQGHCASLKDTPQFEGVFDSLCATLNRWIRDCKCDSAIIYTTNSSSNFRLRLAYTNPYKGQRPEEKPVFFPELKEKMSETFDLVVSDGNEADDDLSIEAWERYRRNIEPYGIQVGSLKHKELSDSVTCSSDKDSTITPTRNYNPQSRKHQWVTHIGELLPKYSKRMVNNYKYVGTGEFWKRGEKSGQEKLKRIIDGQVPSKALEDLKGSGLKFFYAQIIMGDNADNYKGLAGYGQTAAFEALNHLSTERELYEATLSLYKEKYGEGTHWCPNYRGTQEYYDLCMSVKGVPPDDWDFWKGKGAYLTAYDRMLEQGRMAWMQTFKGEIWRSHKSRIIYGDDKEFWHDR
ncbi:exonuclease [Marinomonas phage CB5A]|uniref:Exonuclease n=1 Tax=Marinomonas phage CB5A TaxID=2022859 RepID=A0A222G3F5_9CAUD|nr:exonuclease [Marinomonas phage CB5A]ASP46300.1 exonuclease [Marinomonas phage CB5A]